MKVTKACMVSTMICAFLFALATLNSALAVSFTAEMVMEMKGQKTTCPFYFKDSTYRFDTVQGGVKGYFIVKGQDDFMTFVVPDKKGYMRVPKQAAILMKNNLFEAFFYAAKKYYKLGSKSKEALNGLECRKEIYTIEGSSGPEKAAVAWVAEKFGFPIKIITSHKGKELAKVELKNIEEKELNSSLFQIPPGYKKIHPSEVGPAKEAKREPAWLKKVKSAPVLNPPFERTLKEGEVIRVKVEPNSYVTFEMQSPGRDRDQWARVEYFAFKDGRRIKNLGEYGGFAAAEFKELPEGTDEVVLVVLKRSPRIKASRLASSVIEIETVKAPDNRYFSSRHFSRLKRPRITLKDVPNDGVNSKGSISFFSRKVNVKEKFYLEEGTSKSWDVFKYGNGKKINVRVNVNKGNVHVFIEEAKASASPSPAPRKGAPVARDKGPRPKAEPIPIAIKFGRWRVKQFTSIPGMKALVPAGDWEMCINQENVIPLKIIEYPICKISKKEIKASTVVFDVTCSGSGQKIRSHGMVTYKGMDLKGGYTVEMGDGSRGIFQISGKWLGNCE